jgi:hypothetical protein
MSDEDESLGDRLSNVAYDATEGVVDLAQGDGDGAVDHFLDMSRDALDVVTDGGFSTWVDRENNEHDMDLRETVKEGLHDAGEWVGDRVHDGVEAVEDAANWVGHELSELNPFD